MPAPAESASCDAVEEKGLSIHCGVDVPRPRKPFPVKVDEAVAPKVA